MAHYAQNSSIPTPPALPDRATAQAINPLIGSNVAETVGAVAAMLRNVINTDDSALIVDFFHELNCIMAALDYEGEQAAAALPAQANVRNQAHS